MSKLKSSTQEPLLADDGAAQPDAVPLLQRPRDRPQQAGRARVQGAALPGLPRRPLQD